MKFGIELHDKFVTLQLQEEKLTSSIAPDLKSEFIFLNQKGHKNLILDMVNVRFADSSGISALLRANSLCKESGGIFILCNPSEHVLKTLSISQLHNVLNIYKTEQEAREAVFMHEIQGDIQDELGEEIMSEFDGLSEFDNKD
jgi:anti-anti-sigma factor